MASSGELTAYRCMAGVCSAGGEPPKGRRSSSAGFSRAAALLATAESGWTEANNKHLFFLLCCKYFTNRAALPARKPILCRGSCLLLRPGIGGTKLGTGAVPPLAFCMVGQITSTQGALHVFIRVFSVLLIVGFAPGWGCTGSEGSPQAGVSTGALGSIGGSPLAEPSSLNS